MMYKLKKDLPDLAAGAMAEDGKNDAGEQMLRIPSNKTGRDDWFFFIDDIKNFDEWFEKV